MKVKAEQNWAWMLFEDDASFYFTALCGSIAIYSVDLKLSPAEADNYIVRGNPYLTELSQNISQNPNSYSQRHIADFNSLPGVSEAVAAWRNKINPSMLFTDLPKGIQQAILEASPVRTENLDNWVNSQIPALGNKSISMLFTENPGKASEEVLQLCNAIKSRF